MLCNADNSINAKIIIKKDTPVLNTHLSAVSGTIWTTLEFLLPAPSGFLW